MRRCTQIAIRRSGQGAAAGKTACDRMEGFVSSGGLHKQDAIGCGRHM